MDGNCQRECEREHAQFTVWVWVALALCQAMQTLDDVTEILQPGWPALPPGFMDTLGRDRPLGASLRSLSC